MPARRATVSPATVFFLVLGIFVMLAMPPLGILLLVAAAIAAGRHSTARSAVRGEQMEKVAAADQRIEDDRLAGARFFA